MSPVQIRGTVLTLRRVDAYHAMTLVAPAIATKFRPGQFITIAVGGPETPMLGRRAFAVHDVRPDHGGTVEFVFEARGPGTRWLAGLRARDTLDTVGPLGRPFPIPRDPSSCLLLGVGYRSSAPLFAWRGAAAGTRLQHRLSAWRRERGPRVRRADRPAERAERGGGDHRRLVRRPRPGDRPDGADHSRGAHRRDLRVRAGAGMLRESHGDRGQVRDPGAGVGGCAHALPEPGSAWGACCR